MPFAVIRSGFAGCLAAVLFQHCSEVQSVAEVISFRRPVEQDRETIATWIMADAEHHEKGMTPDFFFKEDSLAMVIGDLQGPGLYIRLDSEPPDSVRLHIQFSENAVKSGKTLLRAWPQFKERVQGAGVKRMVFETVNPSLSGFCIRCFGFKRVSGTNDYELEVV